MRTVYQDKIIRDAPSEYLLEHFTFRLEPKTYEEYVEAYWVDYILLGTSCNARFDSIRMEYEDGTQK